MGLYKNKYNYQNFFTFPDFFETQAFEFPGFNFKYFELKYIFRGELIGQRKGSPGSIKQFFRRNYF